MSETRARLIVWSDGAYACQTHDSRTGTWMLIQYDGQAASRRCRVARDGFEETVTHRATLADGVVLRSTTLSGDRRSTLAWSTKLDRPGLVRRVVARREGTRATWEQRDSIAGLEVVYRRDGAGRYAGEVRDRTGALVWRSTWEAAPGRGWQGTYTTPDGRPAGSVSVEPGPGSGPEGRNGGPFGAPWSGGMRGATGLGAHSTLPGSSRGGPGPTTPLGGPSLPTFGGITRPGAGAGFRWDGPGSRGRGASAGSSGGVSMQGAGGTGNWTWGSTGPGWGVGAGGYTTPTGGNVNWVSVSRPGGRGSTNTTEWGTQQERGHDERYTIERTSNADGSSSFTRTSVDAATGETETSAGATDADGNRSVSTSIVGSDGSYTLTTTTVDKDGNGTVHTTVVDKDGNVVSDQTRDVGAGASGGSGGGSGGSGGGGGGSGGSSASDPNNAGSGSMTAPDADGTSTGGGGSDTPGAPGRAGASLTREMKNWIGAALAGEPGDDRDGATRAEEIAQRLEEEIRRGGVGSGGEHDDGGWGSGERTARKVLDADFFPPENEDEILNHPQALVAHVAQLLGAAGIASRSANLIRS